MPQLPDTSPAFKSYVLQQQGLSPDNYDLTDDGQIISRQQSSPAVAPALSPVPSQESDVQSKPSQDTSVGGTLLHSAESSAFPTATGLGAGALGVMAAPETGGLSLLIPLIAGALGSYAGEKIQQPLMSDAFKQQQAAEQEQHPIASTFGSMIPSLPFFNPILGIKNIPKAAGAAYELALGRVGQTAASTEANQALRNALIGGGLQGGQDVYSQMQGNQPFNYGQLATSVGGGALLNEPWGLGKMLFPQDVSQPNFNQVQAKPKRVHGEIQGIQSPEMEQGIAAAHEAQRQQNENFEKTIPGLGDWKKTYSNQVEDLEAQRDKLQSVADDVNELVGRRTDALSQIEDLKNKINLAKGEPLTDEQGQVLAKPAESGIIPSQETPSEVERGGSNEMPSKTTTGMFSSTVPAESAVEKAMNKTTRYQEEPATKTEPAESQPVNDNDPLLLRNASPEYQKAVQTLAAKRGITLREAMGLTRPETGNEVLGAYNPNTRTASVNPNRAELDTPIHEGVHGYLDDLTGSANPADRNLYQRAIGIFGGDEAHAEEALTGKLGVAGVPRVEEQLHGFSLRQFNSWFHDYVARWKNTLGVASDNDVIRHLSARYQHDAPYGTRAELNPQLRYTGFQPGMAGREGFRMFTATDDIKDKEGNVLVPKDSTVSDKTLESKGINYQEHSNLLRPTDVGYNDLSTADKDEYARLHGEAMVARKEHEVGAHEGTADNLIDKELALKKFSEEKGMKYQDQPSEELKNWYLKAPHVLANEKGLSQDYPVSINNLKGRLDNLASKGVIPRGEMEYYKNVGIDKFMQEKPRTIKELRQWMQDNGPKVEVRKFGESYQTPEIKEWAQLQHWRDSLTDRQKGALDSYNTPNGNELLFNHFQGHDNLKARRYVELQRSPAIYNKGNASHWQSIAPKSEKDMPGYVEIAVTKPPAEQQSEQMKAARARTGTTPSLEERGIQFPSTHSFPPNTLAFARGYMETLPSGEKAFHVIEVQSDWAQQAREQKELADRENMPINERNYKSDYVKQNTEPLLHDYNRLALKAAIEHARSEGATKIIVQDAESAMMMEGHDRETRVGMRDAPVVPKQEKGMRLNYDTLLPRIAEELTGSKGEKVSLGEHKMAFDNRLNPRNMEDGPSNTPRKDLIFRNPDGTPKTDVSGRAFDITKRTEPFSLAGKYQEKSNLRPNEEEPQKYKQLPITRSALDTMVAKDGPRAIPVAAAVAKNENLRNEYTSDYKQPYNYATSKLTDAEKNHIEQVGWKENRLKQFFPEELNPRELDAYNKIRANFRTMQEDRIEANQPVKGVDEAGKPIIRQAGIDPHYWPNQISPQVLHTLHEGDSPESTQLRNDWDAFQMAHGMTPTESRESLDAILGSYSKSTPNLAHFRGVDVEQGHGLPDSFMRPGLDRNMDRYINRFSSARAYHDAVESDLKLHR